MREGEVMTDKHTPGPWGFDKDMEQICDSAGKSLISGGMDSDLWFTNEADIPLVTAAPDLLATLKSLLAACEDDCGAPCDNDEDDEPVGGGMKEDGSPDPMALTFGHLRRAAVAIAKAEGRS